MIELQGEIADIGQGRIEEWIMPCFDPAIIPAATVDLNSTSTGSSHCASLISHSITSDALKQSHLLYLLLVIYSVSTVMSDLSEFRSQSSDGQTLVFLFYVSFQ